MLTSLLVSATLGLVAPDDPGAARAEVRRILENAAAAQNADAVAADLRDFSVRLYLTRRDDEGSRVELDVHRKFKAPDMLWTRIEEKAISGSTFQQGFDGKTSWMHDEDRDETLLYEGPEYRTDRKQIETDLKTMRQLLRFLFLRNLIPALSDLERLEDASDGDLHTMVVRGRGRLPETDDKECVVTLWIEKGTDLLIGARLEVEGNVPMQFCFWNHAPNPQGIVVPGSTKVYRNDEELPSEVLSIVGLQDDDGDPRNDILFNTGIDDGTFRPPSDG
ncbi:MAG: hypothetical protein ACF8XB_00010 [Planctomycetota bacterium JB042]